MILGISTSGRKNHMIHQTVEAIAKETGMKYEIISLAGKRINGCIGCEQCASDNICKLEDDWKQIGEKMTHANALIFGAPNYFGTINALGHACLERTFCFRHLDRFALRNKYGISVSTTRIRNHLDPVREIIQQFMKSNKMNVLGHVTVEGYDPCYTCGFGHNCEVGNVVKKFGILERIEKKHLPPDFSEQIETLNQVKKAAKLLKNQMLRSTNTF